MKSRPCTFCGQPIGFITTKERKHAPVSPQVVQRMGSAPPPAGKYYDEYGELYDASEVPNGLKVWRSHWGDCPKAKQKEIFE
jgi:hypothetical protein